MKIIALFVSAAMACGLCDEQAKVPEDSIEPKTELWLPNKWIKLETSYVGQVRIRKLYS